MIFGLLHHVQEYPLPTIPYHSPSYISQTFTVRVTLKCIGKHVLDICATVWFTDCVDQIGDRPEGIVTDGWEAQNE